MQFEYFHHPYNESMFTGNTVKYLQEQVDAVQINSKLRKHFQMTNTHTQHHSKLSAVQDRVNTCHQELNINASAYLSPANQRAAIQRTASWHLLTIAKMILKNKAWEENYQRRFVQPSLPKSWVYAPELQHSSSFWKKTFLAGEAFSQKLWHSPDFSFILAYSLHLPKSHTNRPTPKMIQKRMNAWSHGYSLPWWWSKSALAYFRANERGNGETELCSTNKILRDVGIAWWIAQTFPFRWAIWCRRFVSGQIKVLYKKTLLTTSTAECVSCTSARISIHHTPAHKHT